MSEEIRLEGLGIAPGVLDTIVQQAAQTVDGVVAIDGGRGVAGLVGKTGGVEVDVSEDGILSVAIHTTLAYGEPLQGVAQEVQTAVAEALESMVGRAVGSVDVYVDGVSFGE
jgi:uncharacterized alkaline shock family protein YloU